MTILLIGLILIIVVLLFLLRKTRIETDKMRQRYRFKSRLKAWPIKEATLSEIDDVFKMQEIPEKCINNEVLFISNYDRGVNDTERFVLCALAKKSKNIFELGTCTGGTAYLLARNSPDDAKIVTVTLHPDQMSEIQYMSNDDKKDIAIANSESCFTDFIYNGTDVESKITQLFSDSKKLDISPFVGKFDLIFIDGSHTYSYVKNDSEKALKMLKPGGIVLWHDYKGPYWASGVFEALNELSEKIPLRHIEKTTLVFYRKPLD